VYDLDSTEKNLLIGAFATAAVDMAFEGYFNYMIAKGTPPTGLPYGSISPWLPPYDDWIASAGFPLLLYALGKGMKKDSLVQMAKGGAIYGVPELVGITYIRVIRQTQAPATYRLVR
jgi:hypothetical protein